MKIEVSNGELLDKYTILMIKKNCITDSVKLQNVEKELDALFPHVLTLMNSPEVCLLYDELFTINETLWDIEDKIRECERLSNFTDEFIQLARSVYKTNDQRAEIKKQINTLTNSSLIEEKSYERY